MLQPSYAQNKTLDSLSELMQLHPANATIAVYHYEHAFYYYQQAREDSFLYFANALLALGKQTANAAVMADYYNLMTSAVIRKQLYDSANIYCRSQISWAMKSGDPHKIGYAYNALGNTYIYLGNGDSAVIYLLRGLPYSEKSTNTRLEVNMLYNLSAAYNLIDNNIAARLHAQKAYEGAAALKDDHLIFNSLFNWATMEVKLNNSDTALIMFENLAAISRKNKDDYSLMDVLNNIGDIYYRSRNFQKSLEQYNSIAAILKNHKEPDYELYLYMNRGNTYIALGNYTAANHDLLKATTLGQSMNANFELMNIFRFRSDLAAKTNRHEDALHFWKMADSLEQLSVNEESRKHIRQLEVKYQTAQKDLAISKQKIDILNKENAIRRKSIQNTALLLGCILLALVLFLAYRNIRHRRKIAIKERELHNNRIVELERKHQLDAMQSILRGQEQERSRLAKDLHDGIGGLLSGVKFGLSAIKNNQGNNGKNPDEVDNVLHMLDNSVSELRRVSHNLMPAALITYGLKEALENYAENINRSGALKIKLQIYGLEKRLNQEEEISIYRIIQELLNNIIKHADATNVLIQFAREGNTFSLTVEDDGKGFDTARIDPFNSAGFGNIKSRAGLLNATVDINTAIGEGTSVTLMGACAGSEDEA